MKRALFAFFLSLAGGCFTGSFLLAFFPGPETAELAALWELGLILTATAGGMFLLVAATLVLAGRYPWGR
jgi:hypothetical protein